MDGAATTPSAPMPIPPTAVLRVILREPGIFVHSITW